MNKPLSIPEPNKYKPFPRKDDGFITKIHLFVDDRPSTKTYTGKLSQEELPAYIKNEFTGATIYNFPQPPPKTFRK